MEYIQPSNHKLKRGNIIRDAVGDGAELKVARRNLNIIRNMHGHCAILNGADNLKHMCDDLQLTDSSADIFCDDAEASADNREEEEGGVIGGADAEATRI